MDSLMRARAEAEVAGRYDLVAEIDDLLKWANLLTTLKKGK